MEPLFLLIIIFGSLMAVRAGGLKARDMYRGKRDAWDNDNPDGNVLRRRAAMLGAAGQVARNGWPTIKESIKDGYAEGKAKGAEKVAKWRPDPAAATEAVDTNRPAPPAPAPTSPAPASTSPSGGRPPLRSVPPAQPSPAPAPRPRPNPAPTNGSNGGVPMAEVNNPETLLAALKLKAVRAAGEVDDATATLARAKGEQANTEIIISSMRKHGFPQAHVDIVTALMDPEAMAVAAANNRRNAALTALGAAQKAVQMAAQHVALQQQGAAGAFYGNR